MNSVGSFNYSEIFNNIQSPVKKPNIAECGEFMTSLNELGVDSFQACIDSLGYWKQKLTKKNAAKILSEAIADLDLDKEIWLPYNDSINIGIKKTANEVYEITVINVGKTEYLPKVTIKGETLTHSSCTISDVPEKNLLNPLFLQELSQGSYRESSSDIIYKELLPSLEGKLTPLTPFYDKNNSLDKLSNSFFAIIRHKMRAHESIYKELKLNYYQNNIFN